MFDVQCEEGKAFHKLTFVNSTLEWKKLSCVNVKLGKSQTFHQKKIFLAL